jgi:hypothetical protein
MSGADLLEDGFPHSTPQGYKAGCQGRSCPGTADNGISCADSFARYQGDYGFRKKVDAGMSPKEIVAAERAATTVAAPKPKPVAKPTADPLSEEARAEVDAAVAVIVDDAPAQKEIPLDKHGTPKGYYLGCRLKDECPGVELVGKSCNQAINEYQKALKENRKKRAAAEIDAVPLPEDEQTALAEDVPAETIPDEALDSVAEHELAGVDSEGELCSCGHHGASLPEHLSEIILGWRNEATNLREEVAALQKRMDERPKHERSKHEQPAVATLPDGTRVTVVVTVERAA